MGELTLTQKEQARLQILNGVLAHQIGAEEAAQVLGLSQRQVWRILAAYRKEGAAAVAHGNRGRSPANALPQETRDRVILLARNSYPGVNHTHLAELLAEREGVALARSTVRRILVGAGLPSPRRRRPPRHRIRRQRMPQEGMLVQVDGSDHDWLEGRGPRLTLLLAVDDATSTVPYAHFSEQEDTRGYFLLVRGIIQRRGIPLALYSDRHGVFQAPGTSRRLQESRDPGSTQFGRALGELGVQQVLAYSPEAKGRVERAAGTFQDRLVSELRLAGACSLEEANRVLWEFLPRFNRRFGVAPAEPDSAYRPVDPNLDLDGILCWKHRRKVARDNTVKYRWHTLQLLPTSGRPSYAGVYVEVQERLDGSLVVCYQDRVIPSREAPPRPSALPRGNGVMAWGATNAPPCLASRVTPATSGGQGEGEVERGPGSEGAAAGSDRPALDIFDSLPGKPASPTLPGRNGRPPTPRQQARWELVQAAMRRGLSLRAIARQLGIARNTVAKYAAAASPPTYPVIPREVSENGSPSEATDKIPDH